MATFPSSIPHSNIKVAVRIKPIVARDLKQDQSNDKAQDDACFCGEWKVDSSVPNSISLVASGGGTFTNFAFDRVFDANSTTEHIYDDFARELIAAAIEGINGTLFAYGQTASGKTFTMHGTPSKPGIIRLALKHLFSAIETLEPMHDVCVRLSYVEIYNEIITDLLNVENRNLKIHESTKGDVFVANATEYIVLAERDAKKAVDAGNAHRRIGNTQVNDRSSRSHTLLRLSIEKREKQANSRDSLQADAAVKTASVCFVDLAGSERASITGAEGVRIKEGGHINKSLLALSAVINKLADGGERTHVPFRDSKLTRILQPSLGGNSRTFIICTISADPAYTEESISSLKFAQRAKSVQNRPVVNEMLSKDCIIKQYQRIIEDLRLELLRNSDSKKALETPTLPQCSPFVVSTEDILPVNSIFDDPFFHQTKQEIILLKDSCKLLKDNLSMSLQKSRIYCLKQLKIIRQKAAFMNAEKEAHAACYEEIESHFNESILSLNEQIVELQSQLSSLNLRLQNAHSLLDEKNSQLDVLYKTIEQHKAEINERDSISKTEYSLHQKEIMQLKKILAEKEDQEIRDQEKIAIAKREFLSEIDKRLEPLYKELAESHEMNSFLQNGLTDRNNVRKLFDTSNQFVEYMYFISKF